MEIMEIIANINEGKYEGKEARGFYEDMCNAHNIEEDDPVSKRIFSQAYEYGHSSGRMEVLAYFQDLVYVAHGEV